jgi:hypothetical protein
MAERDKKLEAIRASLDHGDVGFSGNADWIEWLLDELTAVEFDVKKLHNEVDCRIEHGAESGGHLEYIRTKLAEIMVRK